MKTNELSSMMLSSTVSLLKLVGTMLYSAIVTTLAWPNTLRISWANKPNIPLLTTLENSHTQSTLATGNDFEKRTVPTRPIPNPTIVPTTSPTRTILKPRAVDIIQTNPLPLLNPTPIPIPTITSPVNHPRTPAVPTSLPIPTSLRMVNSHLKNANVVWTTSCACIVVKPVIKLATVISKAHHLPKLRLVLPKLRKRRHQLLKKRLSSPQNSAQAEDCVLPSCAPLEYCHLNVSALFNPNFFHIPLTSPLVSDSETPIPTLIDSGSSHCFVDTSLTSQYNLPVSSVLPIRLKLLDGSTSDSVITSILRLPVKFSTGESQTLDFFVLPLDPTSPLVLGLNWLTRYNPLIDWVLGSITFRPQLLDSSIPPPTSFARSALLPSQNPSVTPTVPPTPSSILTPPSISAPPISIVSPTAFMLASKLDGSQMFQIRLSDTSISAKSASISDDIPDLSSVPEEYHEFADVFNKKKADTLPPHRPYNLKINLEEGSSPPVGHMYSVSQSELQTLR